MSKETPGISDQAVQRATGRSWSEWEAFLDAEGAAALAHAEIVALLGSRGEIGSAWWRQMVANGYEKRKGRRSTGQTEGAGYQIGVQRTIPLSHEEAWRLLTSAVGVRLWLGEAGLLHFEEGERYRADDGAEGEVRVVRPGQQLRLTWQPAGWARPSTIQLRLSPKGEKTTVAFHQERLPEGAAREERRVHFGAALDALVELAGR